MSTTAERAALREAEVEVLDRIYANPLAAEGDLASWRMEGPGATSFPLGRLRLESTVGPADEGNGHFVLWCPEALPDEVRISWTFTPLREPGLAMLFLGAVGHGGRSVLDPSLAERDGPYAQYHHGDLDALHASYFRRAQASERRFHTANLRKSHGFHLVCQGADPIPSVDQSDGGYRVAVTKAGPLVRFEVDGLRCWTWVDDGERYGPVLGGGHIGLRQMSPLIAEYADLVVERVRVVDSQTSVE